MIIFLWNLFARFIWLLSGIFFECFLYYIFREVFIDHIGGFMIIFDIIFVVWLIIDTIFTIIAGTVFGFIRYLFSKI